MLGPATARVEPGGQDTGSGMMTRLWTSIAGAACLLACAPQIAVDAPQTGNLSGEAIQMSGEGPPPGPDGTCWAHDLIPAVYETTTEQSLVTSERRDAAGNVVSPASYRSVSRLRILQDRRDIWFTAPCPEQVTPGFLATLQRALKARGYYKDDLTGVMDDATAEALRKYQAHNGLDSPLLSRAAAQQLGVLTTALIAE